LWPGLSLHFGLHPWDVERLSQAEIERYVHALNRIKDAAEGD
jgi:hypothetical protein